MNSDEMVGIVFFLCVFGAVAVVMYFRLRAKQETQLTLRKAIDQGQTLSEEMVKALSGNVIPSPIRDLRRGIVLIAIAMALFGFAFLIEDNDASMVFSAAALFPLLIGISFLILQRVGRGES